MPDYTEWPTLHVEYADSRVPRLEYQTPGAAGLDLAMGGWYDETGVFHPREFVLPSGYSIKIRTGIRVAIPTGYVGLLTGRSGLGIGSGLESRLGIIDADYRGEIFSRLYLCNRGGSDVRVDLWQRVAQLVVVPAPQMRLVEVADVAVAFPTRRGTDGLGSTGR